MSPVWGQVAGALIVLMMLTFIGIWIWAWRRHHRPVFDQLAQLPMQDEVREDDIDQGTGTDASGTRTGKPGDHA